MAQLTEYLWIAVVGGMLGFMYGFLIGANDVANAFASSVSSKSVTLKQAVLIASVCEFSGAFFLGASVTGTVRSGIFDVQLYADEPDLLMWGMFTSLFAANAMLFIATHMGLPVSTTHDMVGCIMGFSIAAKGFSSINWSTAKKIFISWITSPLIAGFFAAIIFGAIKFLVMRAEDPFKRAYYTFPIVLTIGIGIDLFYVLYKGAANFDIEDKINVWQALLASFGGGAVIGVLWIFVFGPCAKRRVEARTAAAKAARAKALDVEANGAEKPEEAAASEQPATNPEDSEGNAKGEDSKVTFAEKGDEDEEEVGGEEPTAAAPAKSSLIGKWYKKAADNLWDQDLQAQSMHESPRAQEIWDETEKFDENAEDLFSYIQVFTACLNSFAHGANDVANTIAPLSAIFQIYQTGTVEEEATVQKWVLAYGGVAIVLGLLLYGYRVMKSIGYKLTMLSPSRGTAAGLGASLTVVTASFLGIPVSSTQCIVGAVTAVGLFGGRTSIQWLFLLKVCAGWVILFFVAVIFSAGVFSFGAYSPSI